MLRAQIGPPTPPPFASLLPFIPVAFGQSVSLSLIASQRALQKECPIGLATQDLEDFLSRFSSLSSFKKPISLIITTLTARGQPTGEKAASLGPTEQSPHVSFSGVCRYGLSH